MARRRERVVGTKVRDCDAIEEREVEAVLAELPAECEARQLWHAGRTTIDVQHAVARMGRHDLVQRLKEIYYAGLERRPADPEPPGIRGGPWATKSRRKM